MDARTDKKPPTQIELIYQRVGELSHAFMASGVPGFYYSSTSLERTFGEVAFALGLHISRLYSTKAEYKLSVSVEKFKTLLEVHLKDNEDVDVSCMSTAPVRPDVSESDCLPLRIRLLFQAGLSHPKRLWVLAQIGESHTAEADQVSCSPVYPSELVVLALALLNLGLQSKAKQAKAQIERVLLSWGTTMFRRSPLFSSLPPPFTPTHETRGSITEVEASEAVDK